MTRVLIADDHQVLLDGLESMLANHQDIRIVAKCSNGEEVLHRLRDSIVDIILLDINMPRMNGLETTKIIRERYPEVKVIALSMYRQPSYINRMLHLGAVGYVLKDDGKEEIIKAIIACKEGRQYLSDDVRKIIKNHKENQPVNLGLTSREKDVLIELGNGLNSNEIAEKLFISFHTVRTHRKHLLQKFDVKNVSGLLAKAKDMGII